MTSKKKILVIDDEPDMVTYISIFLEDEGFQVASAHGGPQGIAKARREAPDLITLDINMPEMSGIEVLTTLRRDPDLAGIPIIIITGVTGFRELTDHRGVRPPEGFMQKPIDLQLLITTIQTLPSQASSEQRKNSDTE